MVHRLVSPSEWSVGDGRLAGELDGATVGAGTSFIFISSDTVGDGPRLHRHAYAETFIVKAGSALFTVDGEEVTATAGQILVVPAGSAHKFANLGPGRLETIDVHESDRIVTEWLE